MKKVVGIVVVTLLLAPAMTTIAVNENNYQFGEQRSVSPADVPDSWLKGADQYQTDKYLNGSMYYGMILNPSLHAAQEFKPTQEELTAVALYFFNSDAPSNTDIIVSIRDALDGVDLTTVTIRADDKTIELSGTWVMFDFDDITVIPEETYYIVCSASKGGSATNCYCWILNVANAYERGIAWGSDDAGKTWFDLEDIGAGPNFLEIDLCFITYFQEPPKTNVINPLILQFLERIIERFPVLARLLKL